MIPGTGKRLFSVEPEPPRPWGTHCTLFLGFTCCPGERRPLTVTIGPRGRSRWSAAACFSSVKPGPPRTRGHCPLNSSGMRLAQRRSSCRRAQGPSLTFSLLSTKIQQNKSQTECIALSGSGSHTFSESKVTRGYVSGLQETLSQAHNTTKKKKQKTQKPSRERAQW